MKPSFSPFEVEGLVPQSRQTSSSFSRAAPRRSSSNNIRNKSLKGLSSTTTVTSTPGQLSITSAQNACIRATSRTHSFIIRRTGGSGGSRVRSLIAAVCFLVLVALVFNLFASAQMSALLSEEEEEDHTADVHHHITNSSNDGATDIRTSYPTGAPTALPVVSQPTTGDGSSTSYLSKDNAWLFGSLDGGSGVDSGSRRKPAPLVANASAQFASRWCDLSGNVDWYPEKDSELGWQRRAPSFLIPGAKYSRTSQLAKVLEQHPDITATDHAEVGFFYEANFRRYVTLQEKTKVLAARQRMYASRAFRSIKSSLRGNTNLLSLDATPGYLFYSSVLPRRMLCVLPWIKLVVVLRNPVDRLWEHYQYAKQKGLPLSLEKWVEKDMNLLQTTGFLPPNATSTQPSPANLVPYNSTQQDVAWYEYHRRTVEGAVGKSLYEIQLRHWIQALRAAGRDPSKDVYVVVMEDLIAQPETELQSILKFLDLPAHVFSGSSLYASLTAATTTSSKMPAKTRRDLSDFYNPYNQRLLQLLRDYRIPVGGHVVE